MKNFIIDSVTLYSSLCITCQIRGVRIRVSIADFAQIWHTIAVHHI